MGYRERFIRKGMQDNSQVRRGWQGHHSQKAMDSQPSKDKAINKNIQRMVEVKAPGHKWYEEG